MFWRCKGEKTIRPAAYVLDRGLIIEANRRLIFVGLSCSKSFHPEPTKECPKEEVYENSTQNCEVYEGILVVLVICLVLLPAFLATAQEIVTLPKPQQKTVSFEDVINRVRII
jgi:hypothetical protein